MKTSLPICLQPQAMGRLLKQQLFLAVGILRGGHAESALESIGKVSTVRKAATIGYLAKAPLGVAVNQALSVRQTEI